MTPKKKALELIKVTFEPIADATNYKGVENDGGKKFGSIEDIAKNVAKKTVKELINENNFYKDSSTNTSKGRLIFWQNVLDEIDKM
jgi:hypothetical protein